jgi:hypothetical protein
VPLPGAAVNVNPLPVIRNLTWLPLPFSAWVKVPEKFVFAGSVASIVAVEGGIC